MMSQPDSVQLLGKRVKLNEPYRPEKDVLKYGKAWIGYQFGIIVEVVSREYDRELRQNRPRNVSLHLFDKDARLYISGVRNGIPVPVFVDFHISEFVLCLDNMAIDSADFFD